MHRSLSKSGKLRKTRIRPSTSRSPTPCNICPFSPPSSSSLPRHGPLSTSRAYLAAFASSLLLLSLLSSSALYFASTHRPTPSPSPPTPLPPQPPLALAFPFLNPFAQPFPPPNQISKRCYSFFFCRGEGRWGGRGGGGERGGPPLVEAPHSRSLDALEHFNSLNCLFAVRQRLAY